MTDKEGQSGSNGWKQLTAFLAGLAMYQLVHMAISAGNFSVERFGIPRSHVSLYLTRMIIPYRICSLLGIMLLTLYDQCGGQGIHKITMGLVWLVVGCYATLLVTYYTGGEHGHLTLYYWMVLLVSFIVGSAFVGIVKVVGNDIAFLLAALPISGILVSSYHIAFLVLSRYIGISNTYFWLIIWQMACAIILTTLTAILISVFYKDGSGENNGSADGNLKDAIWKAISPLMMAVIGFGMQNLFYPSIAPYKLIGMSKGYKVDVAVLFTSSVPPLVLLCLEQSGMGPNRVWSGGNAAWHATWIFFIIEAICGVIFLMGLHYPGYSISRRIRTDLYFLGVLTVTYDLCVQILRAVNMNSVDKQGGTGASKMDTFNTFAYSFSQILFAFMGDGYLKTYSKYEKDKDNWPTKHYGRLRAFWFWIWNTGKGSLRTMLTAFTTNVRGAIYAKNEYLFIVYTDG